MFTPIETEFISATKELLTSLEYAEKKALPDNLTRIKFNLAVGRLKHLVELTKELEGEFAINHHPEKSG